MCYRCEVCHEVSRPKQQQLRYAVLRPRPVTPWNLVPGTEVAREVAVCPTCHRDLTVGSPNGNQHPMALADLMAAHAFTRVDRLEKEKLIRAACKRVGPSDLVNINPRAPKKSNKDLPKPTAVHTTRAPTVPTILGRPVSTVKFNKKGDQ